MSKIITDSDLDRAHKAVCDWDVLDDAAAPDEETTHIAVVATYRDLWGIPAAEWVAKEHFGMTYQSSPQE